MQANRNHKRTAAPGARGDGLRASLSEVWLPRTDEIRRRLTASYQPMLAFMMLPAAAYFALMTGFYFVTEDIRDFLLLGAISSSTALTCLALRRNMAGRKLTFHGLEARGVALFILVYAGLVVEHQVHLRPEKLPLFMFLMLVTATASVSIRVAVSVVILCTATAIFLAGQASAETQMDVLLVALACSLVAFSMTVITRLAIIKEVRARVAAEKLRREAEHVADHDALTELPNRRVFLKMLEARFKKRKGSGPAFAIAIVDLDGFATINDTFGYSVGDGLLVEIARRLRKVCGTEKFLARIGGDKFGILVDGPLDTAMLTALGTLIRNEASKPVNVMGIRVSATASVGIVPEQISIFTGSEMFERADFAMASGKAKRNELTIFSEALEKIRREKNAIEHNLRYSDLEEEMHVVFQPQIDLSSGRTVGFEALARWENRELGRVPPDAFIAAAERNGTIGQLTPMLLGKALEAARHWPDGVKLSFNLSIHDISSPQAIERICEIVRSSGFPPQRLEFEVTETLIMHDFEQAQRSLDMLHAMGSRVGLDDFGVGYANFGHIDQLKINTIKIDRSFVTRLGEGGNSGKIVKTMIDMCASLGAACVLEGVETETELAALRRMGARFVQGYYFSPPIRADEIAAHFARELAERVGETPAPAARLGRA